MTDLSGQTIKGYELQKRIGQGGFGEVYQAYQPAVKRTTALKVILPEHTNNPEFVRRFEAEAQLVAHLEHFHIVPLYDYWRDPSGAYLVMRFLRGGSLQEILRNGPWPAFDTARIVDQITGALAHAHRNRVVHRDLKPANILLDDEQNAYLSDFGIAKDLGRISDSVTLIEKAEEGRLVGSPDYMSPEQIQGNPITARSDIYSMGILLYNILTGRRPFTGPDLSTIISAQLYQSLPDVNEVRPDLPDAINIVIERATEKDPEDRYESILEMAAELRVALNRDSVIHTLSGETMTPTPPSQIANIPTTAGPQVTENPYKGLQAFQEVDAEDFYGRDDLIEGLLDRFRGEHEARSRFISVVGPSGSGKSSAVKAGLLPQIRAGVVEDSEQWFILEMTPGTRPLEELEAALLRIAINPPPSLIEQLERDERGLVRALKRVLPEDDTELLLVLDQFEELFTQVASEATRTHFLSLLQTAVSEPGGRLRLIVTLRADFYDRPLQYPEFGALVRECTELVLPLSKEELREVILTPAQNAGLVLEPELIPTIITDVYGQPGVLPLLQYALTELFERRDGNTLTVQAYHDIGGAGGALAKRATQIYEEQDEAGQQIAQQVFLRLVTLGEGSEDTRRRALLGDLYAMGQDETALQTVLDTFGKYRLLTFDNDPATREPTVEVAHEALIRRWDLLRAWLDENREALRMQRRLANATQEWLQHDRDPSFLARGTQLEQYETWMAESDLARTADELAYYEASIQRREQIQAEEAAQRARETALEKRSRTVLRVLLVVMSVAAVIAFGLSTFAFNQSGVARENAATATHAQGEAIIQAESAATAARVAELSAAEARSLALVSGAQVELINRNTDLALLLGIEAVNTMETPSTQAIRTLSEAAYAPGTRRIFQGHTDRVEAVAFSTDGSRMLSGGDDGQVILWDTETGEITRTFDGHTDWVWDVTFSPDDTRALSASRDQTIILWDTETGEILQILEGHTDDVQAVAFSPDGTQALSGAHDNTMILWDLETGEILQTLAGHAGEIHSVAFSQSGFTAISGSADGSVILWNLQSGQALQRYEREDGAIWSLTYQPGEVGMVTGAHNGALLLWSFETGAPVRTFEGHTDRITGVAFSPDGTRLASSSQDGTAILWDVETGAVIRRYIGHTDRVYDIAYHPSGDHFVSAGWDQELRLWDVASGAELRRFGGHDGTVTDVAISADLAHIATASEDNTVIIWDAATGEVLHRLEEHIAPVQAVVFTPDNEHLLSSGFDRRILMWDIESGELVREFANPHSDTVFDIAINSDGTRLVSGSRDNTAIIWDVEQGERIERLFGHTFHILSVAFSPDDSRILTAGRDNNVIIWDTETGAEVRRFEQHNDWVFTAAYSPDGTQVLSGGGENTLILWDAPSGEPLRVLEGHSSFIYDVTFSPDGRHALSSAADQNVILWDLETGAELQRYSEHTDDVREVLFVGKGDRALSASGDGTARLWQITLEPEALLNWIRENRYLRELTCVERETYAIAPLCPTPTPVLGPGSV